MGKMARPIKPSKVIICEDHAKIQVGSTYALIDLEDVGRVSPYGWGLHHGYVIRGSRGNTPLHRFVMQYEGPLVVDHINGNPLDCQKSNLRVCSNKSNTRNRGKLNLLKSSLFKGVSRHHGRWQAHIRADDILTHLGTFDSEIAAARAYNEAAIRDYGAYARLNKLPPQEVTFRTVEESDYDFLYELLLERPQYANISNSGTVGYNKHIEFCASNPYPTWLIIMCGPSRVGSVYLTDKNEIGLFIKVGYQGLGIGKMAIRHMMQYSGDAIIANVSVHNERSKALFARFGFQLVQQTYRIRPKE
jgi:hypothetical protein